ncbi:MAG: acetate--CoA ligase family protein, partial [Thermomicrobiales bacterium]
MTDCARRAAGWLVRAQGPDGAIQDRFDRKDHHSGSAAFNEVRHAAATMMLWKATQLAGGESLLPASEAAVAYIRRSATPIGSQELGYVHRGKLKLGGQSLAIVALIERKAITGDTEDDEQIGQLAAFLSRLEKPEQPGSFYQSVERGQMGSTESSEVYEGQALYALVRLQALLPESNRAELLERALHFHLFVRDGEITARSRPPREDLWLTLALTESPDLASSPAARALIALQASSMMSGIQKLGRHAGAADARRVPAANRSAAGMARRIEALGAVEAWARREGDTGLANRCHQSVIQALPSILVKDGKRNPGDDSELQALWESASDEHQIRLDTVTHVLGAMLTVLREERIDPRVEDSPPDADAASESPRRGRHRTITRAVYDAAIRRSIPVRTMSYARERVDLGTGIYQQRFWGLSVSTDSHHGARIAQDKYVAKRLLAAAGLPTPEGYPARTLEQALDRAATMGYPVVLKPRSGNKGQDVYLDLQNDDELTRAWNLLARADPPGGPLIERFLPGEEYRVLVIGGSVAAANHRIPPSVVGDGRATILQLIEKENARPERFTVGLCGLCRIVIDDHMRDVLARDGKSLDAILPQGQRQLVRRTTNVSTGATTAEVTDCMHPDYLMICQTAARVGGLEIAGVDFVARV